MVTTPLASDEVLNEVNKHFSFNVLSEIIKLFPSNDTWYMIHFYIYEVDQILIHNAIKQNFRGVKLSFNHKHVIKRRRVASLSHTHFKITKTFRAFRIRSFYLSLFIKKTQNTKAYYLSQTVNFYILLFISCIVLIG